MSIDYDRKYDSDSDSFVESEYDCPTTDDELDALESAKCTLKRKGVKRRTAYQFFLMAEKGRFKKQKHYEINTEATAREYMSLRWKSLSPEARQIYQDMAREDLDKFSAQLAEELELASYMFAN